MVNTGFKTKDVSALFNAEIDTVFRERLVDLLEIVKTYDLDCINNDYSFREFKNKIHFSFEATKKIFFCGIHQIKREHGIDKVTDSLKSDLIEKCKIISDYYEPLL